MVEFELHTVNREEQACTFKHDGLTVLISHAAYPDAGMYEFLSFALSLE